MFWLLLGGRYELGTVIERGRRRSDLWLKTEMWVTGLSCGDGPEWEG
jgi:hypothetical protein